MTVGTKILVLLLLPLVSLAQNDTCSRCKFPCKRSEQETFTILMSGGRVDPIDQYLYVVRDTIHVGSDVFQALRLTRHENGRCRDTLIVTTNVSDLVLGRTLGKVPPLYVPIHPVPEYQINRVPDKPTSFIEVGALVSYAGADSSVLPRIGFENVFYGAEALIAPFGSLLGEKLSMALGGGAWFEGGRMRFPLLGHLRYTFMTPSTREAIDYVPNACTFDCGQNHDPVLLPSDPDMVRLPGPDLIDSTAALVRTTEVVLPERAPYMFIEGGYVMNGTFEGRGPEPSVNPEDYGQYMIGLGAGIPIIPRLHAQLAYRYARLNLRTPCVDCNELFTVNTNSIHALMLRLVLHWGW